MSSSRVPMLKSHCCEFVPKPRAEKKLSQRVANEKDDGSRSGSFLKSDGLVLSGGIQFRVC